LAVAHPDPVVPVDSVALPAQAAAVAVGFAVDLAALPAQAAPAVSAVDLVALLAQAAPAVSDPDPLVAHPAPVDRVDSDLPVASAARPEVVVALVVRPVSARLHRLL
jgi:hypothetical protein